MKRRSKNKLMNKMMKVRTKMGKSIMMKKGNFNGMQRVVVMKKLRKAIMRMKKMNLKKAI
jgi:hypothetical protein